MSSEWIKYPEQQPADTFSAIVAADTVQLFGMTKILARVDRFEDQRPASAELSKTDLWPHEIFEGEQTEISSFKAKDSEEEYERFSLSTFITLTEGYMNGADSGHFSSEKVDLVANIIRERLPTCQVVHRSVMGHEKIDIIGEKSIATVDFGYSSAAVEEAIRKDIYEITKEIDHPEGTYHEEFNEFLKQFPIDEPTPEEEDWENEWRKQAEVAPGQEPLIPETRNRHINLRLQGLSDSENVDEMLAGLFHGAPLASHESFEEHLELYTDAYSAVINAICTAEDVLPPTQEVQLGARLT